jgi:hypothetical protein
MLTADPRPRPALSSGTRIGSSQIVAALGAGAMGDVYRARDLRLDREVALKLLSAGDPVRREQIEREARIVASLNHPNVVAVHDIGLEDGAMYIVTELVDGDSLRGAKPPFRKAVDIAVQIADALAAAHAAGVIHRDLKPDNVMVARDGRVKLLDFCIATSSRLAVDPDETLAPGREGVVTGTVGYMAPEQVRADAAHDARADIFSFGALIYEVLTGSRAFAGDTGADVIAAVLTADPPELPSTLPGAVREIVQRCLEKRPEDRFQSARDLAFALRQAAAAGAVADVPSPPAVREQLARLTSSSGLANAERLSSLLRFVVEEALNGHASQLKEARIGLEVFGRRPDSYDPAIDPIVRVQMGRLRTKLRAHYQAAGAADPVRIDIPVGTYAPMFESARGGSRGTAPPATAADRPRLPGRDARRVERVAGANGSLLAPEQALAAVVERRIAVRVQAGTHDVERAPHFRTGDVIDEEDAAAFAPGREIDLEPELVVVNHDRLRTGDGAREHLVAGVDECAVDEIEDRGDVIQHASA